MARAAWASKRVLGHPAKLDMFQWVRENPRGAASKRGAHLRLVAVITLGLVRALARPDLTKERRNASHGGKFRGDGLGFGDVREGTEGGGQWAGEKGNDDVPCLVVSLFVWQREMGAKGSWSWMGVAF